MRWLKLFENFQDDFPDVFGESLLRGVKIDKEEYIDDPKNRKISTGQSSEENYLNFLKNYKSVGLQDPTKSIHFYLNPTKNQIDNLSFYGYPFNVIPEKNAEFSFSIELRNGGLGSTYFFPISILKEFTDTDDRDFNPDWKNGFDVDFDYSSVSDYQKFLIKNGVVGNLTYEELLDLAKKGSQSMQIWTESRVLHKRIVKSPKEPKVYKKEPLLKREDFEKVQLNSKDIGLFYSSDFGKNIKRLENILMQKPNLYSDLREEALQVLKKYKSSL